MAALWHSRFKKLALADWPLSGNLYDNYIGHGVRIHQKVELPFATSQG